MFRPVLAGFWTHKDIVQDVFTFQDLLDIHEMLDAREEQQRRVYDAIEKRRQG